MVHCNVGKNVSWDPKSKIFSAFASDLKGGDSSKGVYVFNPATGNAVLFTGPKAKSNSEGEVESWELTGSYQGKTLKLVVFNT